MKSSNVNYRSRSYNSTRLKWWHPRKGKKKHTTNRRQASNSCGLNYVERVVFIIKRENEVYQLSRCKIIENFIKPCPARNEIKVAMIIMKVCLFWILCGKFLSLFIHALNSNLCILMPSVIWSLLPLSPPPHLLLSRMSFA